MHQQLTDLAASQYVSLTQLSITAAAASDREQALASAKRAWDERDPFLYVVARHYPDYQWFREQPEFAAILREMDASGEGSP